MKLKGISHYKNAPIDDDIIEMLRESNAIEREYTDEALEDAIEAWKYAVRYYGHLTTKYVLKIHKLLCRRLRPDIAGKWRTCDVYIGGERKIFISEAEIINQVKTWINDWDSLKKPIEKMTKEELEKHAIKAHVHFEGIHPFEDGNGRTGRILYQIHRLRLGLPINIIHEGDEQWAYYRWFNPDL